MSYRSKGRKKEACPKRVAVFDTETDPFLAGREPLPFVVGFYDGASFSHWWGSSCIEFFGDYLATLKEPLLIYAHNGGKFDFFFLLAMGLVEGPIKIIGGRLVEARIGIHTLRDSVAIIPVALGSYKKDEIDYAKMEADVRDSHKDEIVSYLKTDCISLYELVYAFVERFGPKLTIAGTAMDELKQTEDIPRLSQRHDKAMRRFYFGGRVQCFEKGIIHAPLKLIDVNSMYPDRMAAVFHPTGEEYTVFDGEDEIPLASDMRIDGEPDRPYFAVVKCLQYGHGSFPWRAADGSLSFSPHTGEYCVTSHELQAAHDCGLLPAVEVIELYVPTEAVTFEDFVNKFMREKIEAEERGDKIGRLFAKLIANSAYGKFAQNPDHFYDYKLIKSNELAPEGYELYADHTGYEVWRRPSLLHMYYDVATAASITGAARAVLLRAIHTVKRPIYCDTDSVVCESADGIDLHPTRIGAWDVEAEGDRISVVGKKLYAMWAGKECVKYASKGLRLTPREIDKAAKGHRIEWTKDAPTFRMTGTQWIKREINRDGEFFYGPEQPDTAD